jgi:hypothetical protein
MGNRAMMATWIVVLSLLPQAENNLAPDDSSRPLLTHSVRPHLKLSELPPAEGRGYIRQLGRERRLDTLLYLAHSQEPLAEYALTTYVQCADMADALRVCRALSPGRDPRWEHAVSGLDAHYGGQVVRYVKQVHRVGNATVRMHCYLLCLQAGWDDLLEEAEADKDDRTVADPFSGLRLCVFARSYLLQYRRPGAAGEMK